MLPPGELSNMKPKSDSTGHTNQYTDYEKTLTPNYLVKEWQRPNQSNAGIQHIMHHGSNMQSQNE